MTNIVQFPGPNTPGRLLNKRDVPRERSIDPFIKGPLPLNWIEAAGRVPGVGLHVAMEIWFKVGLTGTDEVKISLSGVGKRFCFHRTTAARGLASLEGVGLVVVQRAAGRAPRVRVVRDPSRWHPCATTGGIT